MAVTLKGFASLPAPTIAPGPPSGKFITAPTNGQTIPFSGQPVQGFSAVQFAGNNTFWFMPDNGYGAKTNSADFLLRLYQVNPSFQGLEGNGTASVNLNNFITLSDPNKKISFNIVNEATRDRLLTGADFDIESFTIAADGSLWFGEEFGPYLLHTNAKGELLDAPIPTPNPVKLNTGFFDDFPGTGDLVSDQITSTVVRSPQNPDVLRTTNPLAANLGGSKGFEASAMNPDKTKLYPLLEGVVVGDPSNALRIYEFDLTTQQYQGIKGFYKLENASNAIGDMTVVNASEYLVIERDGGQGADAKFKKIFKIDFSQKDAQGFFAKEEIADLLNIADPQDFNKDGSTTYRMPFVTIENVLVIDDRTILVANDNNYPFSIGRPPGIDNNEIVLLSLDKTLRLDPRVGQAGLNFPTKSGTPSGNSVFGSGASDLLQTKTGGQLFGNGGQDRFLAQDFLSQDYDTSAYGGTGDDTFFFGNGNNTIYGNGGSDRFTTGSGNDLIYGGSGDDVVNSGTGEDGIYLNGGRDRVVLTAGQGSATIYGFDSDDTINLGSGLANGKVTIDRMGQDTILSRGNDLLANLKGYQNSNVLIA
jgi:hypothetical protein